MEYTSQSTSSPQVAQRWAIAAIVLFLLCSVMYMFITQISGAGKIAVDITTLPDGVSVYANKQKVSLQAHLAPGTYEFVGKKTGYRNAVITQDISQRVHSVVLFMEPATDEARVELEKYKEAHPNIGSILGDKAADIRAQTLRDKNPVIDRDLFPYSDSSAPFRIRYLFYPDVTEKVYLSIDYSTPEGRRKALTFLRRQNIDITTTDIRFTDFTNPLTQKTDAIEGAVQDGSPQVIDGGGAR